MQPVAHAYSPASPEDATDISNARESAAGASELRVEEAPRFKLRLGPWLCVLLSVPIFLIALLGAVLADQANLPTLVIKVFGTVGFTAGAFLALGGFVFGMVRLGSHVLRHRLGGIGLAEVASAIIFSILALLMTGVGAMSALVSTAGFSRGRQLRRRGRVLLPPIQAGSGWASASLSIDGLERAPVGLAEQWRENGRTEHASVASFARLTLDLMALGAPPSLVASANLDALDEIRHTEACFALAFALDGKLESPGPFPEAQSAHTLPRSRRLALAKLAVTSLVDGALHEGVSARIIAKLARRSENPVISDVLRRIAADEGRHAAHGWDVVEWCLREGGSSVAFALRGALRFLPEQMHSALPEAARMGEWEPWGIHGSALETEEYSSTRRHVLERVRALVTPWSTDQDVERAA